MDHEEDSAREVHVELFLNNIVTEFSVAQVKIYLGVTLNNHHLLISFIWFLEYSKWLILVAYTYTHCS